MKKRTADLLRVVLHALRRAIHRVARPAREDRDYEAARVLAELRVITEHRSAFDRFTR